MRILLSAWLKTSPPRGAIFSELHETELKPRGCCPLTGTKGGTVAAAGTLCSVTGVHRVLETCFPSNPAYICWSNNMTVVLGCCFVNLLMWELYDNCLGEQWASCVVLVVGKSPQCKQIQEKSLLSLGQVWEEHGILLLKREEAAGGDMSVCEQPFSSGSVGSAEICRMPHLKQSPCRSVC